MSTRDAYIQKMKDHLDEWNAEVDKLEKRMHEVSDDAKAAYEKRLAEARSKQQEFEKKIQGLRDAGDAAWEDVKNEAEHAWKAFHNSVNYFKSHFK